jgi:hypothetical protein
MGCHTWFYKKVERSIEEARQKWIEVKKDWIERWKEICNDPNAECRFIFEWSQEYCDWSLSLYERQLRMVEKGLCNMAVMNQQPEDEEGSYEFVDNILYCNSNNLPHNIFRISGYPEDKLHSIMETMRFCVKNNIKLTKEQKYQLQKFWFENPEGLITFG